MKKKSLPRHSIERGERRIARGYSQAGIVDLDAGRAVDAGAVYEEAGRRIKEIEESQS